MPCKRPTTGGNLACPGLQGAAKWPSKSFDPVNGLYFTMASRFSRVFIKRAETQAAGKTNCGGTLRELPGER